MPCKISKESYFDSYSVVTDSIKKSNPSLSDHDVRVHAAQKFRLTFHRMQESAKIENSGQEVYKNGEFTITDDGRMYYPADNTYAEDLHLNQLRASELANDASKFSLSDYQTTLLIQSSIRNGARVVVTSYSRRTGDNCDVLEYRYDPVTRKGSVIVHNAAPDGNFHSFEKIKQIAKSKFAGLHESAANENVFVLSDTPLPEKVIRQTVDSVHYAGKQTMREVGYTARSVQRYIETRLHKPVEIVDQIPRKSFTDRVKHILWQKPDAVPQMQAAGLNKVSERKRERKKLFRVTQAVVPEIKKSIAQHERKVRKINEQKEARSVALKKEVRVRKKKEEIRIIRSRRERVILFAEKRVVKKPKIITEAPRRIQKEKLFTKRAQKEKVKMERVIRLFALARKLVRTKERTERVIRKKSERREQKHALDFSLAFVVWLFLQKRYRVPLPAWPAGRHESKKDKRFRSERLLPKESTAWILLAIIWYLAMIRESGKVSVKQQKQKKSKVFGYTPVLPMHGVIFAFE